MVAPLRVRELKQDHANQEYQQFVAPLRVRELKLDEK